MKLDRRFHCFGCGADGDVIDFVAALYGLGKKEAAAQLASDFGGLPMRDWKPPGRAKEAQAPAEIPEEQFREAKAHIASVSLPIIYTSYGYGKPTMPRTPRRKRFIPVRGSLAEASPCGISAGCAAVWGYRGKSGS